MALCSEEMAWRDCRDLIRRHVLARCFRSLTVVFHLRLGYALLLFSFNVLGQESFISGALRSSNWQHCLAMNSLSRPAMAGYCTGGTVIVGAKVQIILSLRVSLLVQTMPGVALYSVALLVLSWDFL